MLETCLYESGKKNRSTIDRENLPAKKPQEYLVKVCWRMAWKSENDFNIGESSVDPKIPAWLVEAQRDLSTSGNSSHPENA